MNYDKPHLPLPGVNKESYKAPSLARSSSVPVRNREEHAAFLRDQLQNLRSIAKNGTDIITLKGEFLTPGPAQSKKAGSEILSVRKDNQNGYFTAVVRVTDKSIDNLSTKITEYETEETTPRGANGVPKPKHMDFINSIEVISQALIEDLFIGKPAYIPRNEQEIKWWELWLAGGDIQREQSLVSRQELRIICERIGLDINLRDVIILVDSQALLVEASFAQLRIIAHESNYLLSFRPPSTAIVQHVATQGRTFDIEPLSSLIQVAAADDPRITVIDTGVNDTHPLLQGVVDGVYSVDPASPSTADYDGHGTSVVSIAAFGDITPLLTSSTPFQLEHFVESVKIPIDRRGLRINLWGKVTVEAIEEAESYQPELNRIFNLSIGHHGGEFDGNPTSWSEAIDKICYNYGYGRLMTIAAGNIPSVNVRSDTYPYLNLASPIESPANAYNAICVGAYTELKDFIPSLRAYSYMVPPANGYSYIGDFGQLSPHSRTGIARSLVKPDVVCEGGNFIADIHGAAAAHEEAGLCYLTTNHDYTTSGQLFCNFWATSKAAPLAARMLAIIWSRNPSLRPATVRGLLIHSASWTASMNAQFPDKNERIRAFGYGKPDLDFACKSASSAVTIIAEESLLLNDSSANGARQMAFYKLPWPNDFLEILGSTKVELRVTLCYFTEPNSRTSAKYYEGAALGWEMQGPTESDNTFLKRVNKERRDEGDSGFRNEIQWQIGSSNRKKGSIQSDRWNCEAAVLSTCSHIAVYPKHGWWADRKKERPTPEIEYSLIISIKSADENVDLYSRVAAIVGIDTGISLPIILPSSPDK